MAFHLPFQTIPMTTKTKVSSQGRTVIPVEIRKKLGIRKGEKVEWTLQGEVIVVKLVREEKTPNDIMKYLKDHLAEIKHIPLKAAPMTQKGRMMDEWTRRKLGLTP